MTKKADLDLQAIIDDYAKIRNLHKLAKKYHTSHIRLSELLKNNGVEIENVGRRRDLTEEELENMIAEYNTTKITTEQLSKKYKIRLKKLRTIFKENGVVINKWKNHIKKESIKPKKIRKTKPNLPTKECPYCGWKTIDVNNKAHAFTRHLLEKHSDIDINEHLKNYPDDIFYLKDYLKKQREKYNVKYAENIYGLLMIGIYKNTE